MPINIIIIMAGFDSFSDFWQQYVAQVVHQKMTCHWFGWQWRNVFDRWMAWGGNDLQKYMIRSDSSLKQMPSLTPALEQYHFHVSHASQRGKKWSPKSFETWYLAPPPSGKIICLTLNIDQWKFRFRKWEELIPLMRRANSTDEKSSDRCWEICFAWILAILYDIKKEQTVQNSCCDGVSFVFCRW